MMVWIVYDLLCTNLSSLFITQYHVGVGAVIQGWDSGVVGMSLGERSKLTIPAKFAYGDSSPAPTIPPNRCLD